MSTVHTRRSLPLASAAQPPSHTPAKPPTWCTSIAKPSKAPSRATPWSRAISCEVGGRVTSCLYVVMEDPDAHHARAAAAGAKVIAPPHDPAHGGRSYEARDLEGNVWSFGSYDPFAIFED